ncbi:hypothetical protein H6S82_30540 [Planktothrix sp. FACHB-1355]|nr:hypothetical protein [Planktothrix sp. FACHB-1355]MBD3563145.1 hypothetical protein [Planktothrix sp. FACHB-1355]
MARKRITLSLDEDLLERIKLAAEKDDRSHQQRGRENISQALFSASRKF